MKKNASLLLGIAVAVLAVATPCHSRVGRTTLAELVRVSDLIVVGKVTDTMLIRGIKVAEVDAGQILKGTLQGKKLYYLAQPTWICDTSEARKGESALLFLCKAPNRISAMNFKEPAGFRRKLRAIAEQAPFAVIAWSGRGRMPLRKIEGEQYATVWSGDVRLPSHIRTIPGPEPEFSGFIRSAKLADLVTSVEEAVRESSKRKTGSEGRK